MGIAVVTGAARGIGAAIADRLEGDGFEVVRLDIVGGDGVIACDVADHAQVGEVAATVAADVGPVDVLVNNAGIWRFGPLESVDPAAFRHVLDVNLGGTFHCTQAFGRGMLDRGGSIVNVVSIAADAPNPAAGAYSPSKAAVLALTRQTAIEWGPRGVRANAVGPGFVPTPGTGEVYDDPEVPRGAVGRRPAAAARHARRRRRCGGLPRRARLGLHHGTGDLRRRRRDAVAHDDDPTTLTTPRPARRALTAPGAIWSLCVSNGDLVTHILDIENLSDQIVVREPQ